METHRTVNDCYKALLIIILTLFCGQNNFGQNREQKTTVVIDSMKTVDLIKFTYLEYQLKPLKFEATGQDSLKLDEIEHILTDNEIKKRIFIALDSLFTDGEINDLYNFVKTTAYRKLMHSNVMTDKILEQFSDIANELEKIDKSIKQQYENNEVEKSQFKPIPIDREDGFYETVDFDSNKDLKDIELVKTPSISKIEISEIKKSTNRFGNTYIDITFTKKGSKQFYLLTKKNIGKPIAIVIDKHIVSIPTVNSEIFGGKASISGDFTTEEIDKMIESLKTK